MNIVSPLYCTYTVTIQLTTSHMRQENVMIPYAKVFEASLGNSHPPMSSGKHFSKNGSFNFEYSPMLESLYLGQFPLLYYVGAPHRACIYPAQEPPFVCEAIRDHHVGTLVSFSLDGAVHNLRVCRTAHYSIPREPLSDQVDTRRDLSVHAIHSICQGGLLPDRYYRGVEMRQ
jgi:hypothetical protein